MKIKHKGISIAMLALVLASGKKFSWRAILCALNRLRGLRRRAGGVGKQFFADFQERAAGGPHRP
jgi:hypothetical protein